MKRPIAVDLFCGAGGLSLGFEQAGFNIAAAVERDPIHAETHQKNFPKCCTINQDLAKINGDEIRKEADLCDKIIDVVIGGPLSRILDNGKKREK